jgi:predicted DNA-binding transcriptional regulator AlpA
VLSVYLQPQLQSPISQPDHALAVLTSKDVAAMLGRNHKTIERHAREGTIPGHFRLSRWYFLKSEIDEWLLGEVNSTSQPDRVN